MIPFLDLGLQYREIEDEIQSVLNAVLQSGQYILGERVSIFEKEFASFCGSHFAVGVGSGTDALHLALMASGITSGDEVITTAFTAVPTALAISAANARPVLCDIDSTYTLDPSQLQRAITPRTKAIIPVHLYGYAADLDAILTIAQDHQIPVIEDACQAHGTEYKGRKVGCFGRMGCFSFYPTKNLGALGDAGMIVTDDRDSFERLVRLRNLGQQKRFLHVVRGFNSRMDEIHAAILSVKLKHLSEWNEKRNILANLYDELLQCKELLLPPKSVSIKPNNHLYVIRTQRRDDLKLFLEQRGIQSLIHYPTPVHLQPAYRDLDYGVGSFPQAEACAKEVLSIPLHPSLTISDAKHIAKCIREFHSG
jgi:dTDP-4-amino-4,6-dideoxygalactose transaminase